MASDYNWLKMAEADKALTRAQKLMREGMEPRSNPRHPIFANHNCGGCDSGAKPCREGNHNSCSRPRARND